MTYVICEPCIGVKDTACVEVCPVDCIHPSKEEEGFEAAEQLYPAAMYDTASVAAQPLTRAELAGEVSRPPRKKKKRK